MAREITVRLADRPGSLARFGEVMGQAGVNIEGLMVVSRGGQSTVQFVADDPATAEGALDLAGLPHSARDVLIVDVLNAPGALGDIALVMAHAGINIESAYARADGKVVFAVDDLLGAIEIAKGMAAM
jgi:hypothetical protein